jgi:predicted O-linked N-acetylglucosamine transferase (SPINDLY family)
MKKNKITASVMYHLQIADSYFKMGDIQKAYYHYSEAVKIEPNNVQALGNLAVTLYNLGKMEEAKSILEKVVQLSPNRLIPLYNLGIFHFNLGNFEEAAKYFQKVIKFNPSFVWCYNNLGTCLKNLGRLAEGEEIYKKGLALDPTDVSLYSNLGNLLRAEGKMNEAIKSYQTAIWLDPDLAEAFGNLGSIFTVLGYFDLARENLLEAIKLKPTVPEFYYNLAMLEKETDNLAEAVKNFEKAAKLGGKFDNLWNMIYLTYRQMCDWEKLKEAEFYLKNDEAPDQFVSLIITDDLSANLKSAITSFSKIEKSVGGPRYFNYKKHSGKKIRVGYISGDFRNHPIGEMVCGMFEYHNREKFEIFAYSYGPDDGSWVRKMTIEGVDKFVDIKSANIYQAADAIFNDNIDILVDITGNTKGNRLEICAMRPAPIQITWLGFPGTSGASCFDYMIADKIVIPENDQKFYTEKILYLPHCYQVNNDKIISSNHGYTRKDFGLPENGIVFSSFNQTYKIDPVIFAVWMRILKKVPNSVLWLWNQYKEVKENLRKQAEKYGINEERIVFGEKLPKREHIERLSLADIGLDTLNYGGHTTTSDSLLAQVPVITILGKHFASRVCASILYEAGIGEMVVKNLKDYENLAIELAESQKKLLQIKAKISRENLLKNLYNTKRFVKSLEDIFEKVYV